MSINKVWFHKERMLQFGSTEKEFLILFSKEKIGRGKRRNFWAWTQIFNFLDINYIYVVGKCVTFFITKQEVNITNSLLILGRHY